MPHSATGPAPRGGEAEHDGDRPTSALEDGMVLMEAAPEGLAKRWRRWPFVLCLVILAAVMVVKAPQWVNDGKLAGLEERVRMLELPPGTERDISAAVQGSVGLQAGNGNHCDFLVRMTVRTRLPDAEIAAYYASPKVEGVAGAELSGRAYVSPYGYRGGVKSVVVEFFDRGHDPGFDLRCH
ncbi:hypothetical protein ACU635_16390 [[Actinomadura] parvosata]|uniref:hypothetical protein n=1 Tax=[Actinomadura] parvosata TaxID=1955412 RepID=UPI00406D2FE0